MNITLESLDVQPLLYFPAGFLDSKPDNVLVEYRQASVKELELKLVDPKSPARSKRYKIVRHNSGNWTSIPKPWLHNVSAKAGDSIDVEWRGVTALLSFKRRAK
jgi:hypothetical protein